MVAITVKNIPEPLYAQLKETAAAHHRSINGELIHCLEQILLPKAVEPIEHIKRARDLREDISVDVVDIDDIQAAIDAGRA